MKVPIDNSSRLRWWHERVRLIVPRLCSLHRLWSRIWTKTRTGVNMLQKCERILKVLSLKYHFFHFSVIFTSITYFKVSISRIISLIAKYSPWKQEKESPGQESNRALPRLILLATQWPDRREVKTQIFTHSWPQKSPISKSYLILHARIEQHAAVRMSSKCQIGIGKPFMTQIRSRDSGRNDAILGILRILFDVKQGSQDSEDDPINGTRTCSGGGTMLVQIGR